MQQQGARSITPHALDPEKGLRVRSGFTFLDFIEIAQPASLLRWLVDVICRLSVSS